MKFAGVRPTAPLSAQLILQMPRAQVDTLAIARANVTRFSVASADMQVTPAGRRYLRALYHAALCTEVPK